MAYYVTIRESNGRRHVFAAGPFNRHGDALRCVGWVHRLISEKFPKEAPWVGFGTARVKSAPLPNGRFNSELGLPVGRLADLPLEDNRWWAPGTIPDADIDHRLAKRLRKVA